MVKFFDKIRFRMAKIGLLDVKHAGKELQDNLDFVKIVVGVYGAEEFKHASQRLRSDANAILELVVIDPEILSYIADEIYDRYYDDCDLVEEEVDKVFLGLMSIYKNDLALAYMDKGIKEKVINTIETRKVVPGKLNGKPFVFDGENLGLDYNFIKFVDDIVEERIVF